MNNGYRLHIRVTFNHKENKVSIESDVKREKIGDLITDFLRDQMGKGKDERKAAELDVYNIALDIDLTDDTFYCCSDCGNDGLRDGILYLALQTLEEEKNAKAEHIQS